MQGEEAHANSVAPILVSRRQGLRKSTFCRSLLPPALQRYYTDNLQLTSQGRAELLLAQMGLLNMDEFDKYADSSMPLLKNLMQMSSLHVRKAYRSTYCRLPRSASFIGTSNRFDLLTDPTGSRRFLCVEVKHAIDCSGIDHAQLYAQLKAELQAGRRSWFSKQEEVEVQKQNERFYRASPDEELFRQHFRSTHAGEPSLDLTAAQIYEELRMLHPHVMRNTNANHFARVLTKAGIARRHTERGNIYRVARR